MTGDQFPKLDPKRPAIDKLEFHRGIDFLEAAIAAGKFVPTINAQIAVVLRMLDERQIAINELTARIEGKWRKEAQIVDAGGKFKIKYRKLWLRYGRGPKTGTFWDVYGDDFESMDNATEELRKASPPAFEYYQCEFFN